MIIRALKPGHIYEVLQKFHLPELKIGMYKLKFQPRMEFIKLPPS